MTTTKEILNVAEAAKFIGCSKTHFRRILATGEIKYKDIALEGQKLKQIRISREELIRWFKSKSRGRDGKPRESKE
jgi:excisionase family DNA binding protein